MHLAIYENRKSLLLVTNVFFEFVCFKVILGIFSTPWNHETCRKPLVQALKLRVSNNTSSDLKCMIE